MRRLPLHHWPLAGGVHVGVRQHLPPRLCLRGRRMPGPRRAVVRHAGHRSRRCAGHPLQLRVDDRLLLSIPETPVWAAVDCSQLLLHLCVASTVSTVAVVDTLSGQLSPSTASQGSSFTFALPPPSPSRTPLFGQTSPSTTSQDPVFDDDEPVEPPSPLDQQVQEAPTNKDGVVVLKTHCEHPAVARDTARDNFAVLVHAKAHAASAELVPSLDLVTVLDVSLYRRL